MATDVIMPHLYDNLKNSLMNENYISFTELNILSFKNILKYLTSLKKDKYINDHEFTELTHIACAIYVENEVERRISKVLEGSFSYFFNSTYRKLF